ncbi:MAG: GIY-YIG nuclease family protein [Chitinophagaceae bacterium]
MKFTVYILFSEQFNKHYTGFTSNLEERLKSHNELGHDWTAKYRPWKILFTKEFATKKEALIYEKWLKTGVGRDLSNHYPTNIAFISAAADGSSSLLSGTKGSFMESFH